MTELADPRLSAWESFYVIVGSSGAALIGLQFVVMALVADKPARATAGSISAFGTPTVVHLGGALLVAAIMSAPWPTVLGASNRAGALRPGRAGVRRDRPATGPPPDELHPGLG